MNMDERIAALSELSYYVTQQNGTERPFTGALNKEYRKGDYFCIVCETKLFTDEMKFDSVVVGLLSIANIMRLP